ncbi:hypothetical protein KFK09_002150 [Dendrobium nobile]|uniref:Uncharacterized protein n=1 Tax=Dendrobium nobile TaxID=94219 RepID=A0A8T3C6S7_DENNO|nr:hypothetical protein KFK09_002150 [Dendrobium nobile]
MEFQSVQFLVKKIDYEANTIQVIETGLLRSNCSLPLKSLGASSVSRSRYYQLESWYWISLMNCSKQLTSLNYQLFPCLSQGDSFVYAVSGYLVTDMAPFCSLLSMMPATDTSATISSHLDLFQAIHGGFSLSQVLLHPCS